MEIEAYLSQIPPDKTIPKQWCPQIYARILKKHKVILVTTSLDHELEILTGMAATGAQFMIFSTGRGAPQGFPTMPVLKVCGNPNTYERMSHDMDINAGRHPGAILAVGNAPTALLTIAEQIENGLRPALVIGVPVGFVNVVESKERLFAVCEKHGVPAIAAMGRKGGSNVAAAICNALIYSAAEMLDPSARGWK